MGRRGALVVSAITAWLGCSQQPTQPSADAGQDAAITTDAGIDAPTHDGSADTGVCHTDADGDHEPSIACGGQDCDDTDPFRFPGNVERCDPAGRDEDCDPTTYGFRDADGDGHPDALCCNTDSAGAVHCGDDCNDMRPGSSPDAPEVCNGIDDDCDTAIDEGVERTFYADADHDGFGDPSTGAQACIPPAGTVENATDCNDANPFSHAPTDPEVCDMQDDDCDGIIDEDSTAVQWYADADGDLYGDAHDPSPVLSCTPVAGHVSNGTDCDDADAYAHPGATERCNVRDDDCSSGGGADPAEDADGDGFAPMTATCLGGLPTTDCADSDASVNPAAGFGTTRVCPTSGPAGPTTWCVGFGCCATAGGCHPFTASCVATGWDLNCDGVDERQPSFTPADCTMIGSGTCTGSGVQYTGSPACGADVMPADCYWDTSSIMCALLMSDGTTPLPCR